MKRTVRLLGISAPAVLGFACAALAQTAHDLAPPQIVVTAPNGGENAVLADTPVNVVVLSGDALTREHHSNLADLLDAALGSVTLSNGTGSPYQSDVAYRGFSATSLLGSPTGLSVWVDGVRMNEPFGSIVNWDLIPLNAIAQVQVLPGSNPLFGLNTLGGSLVLTTKNGANNTGAEVTVQGGSLSRRAVLGEAGGHWRTRPWIGSLRAIPTIRTAIAGIRTPASARVMANCAGMASRPMPNSGSHGATRR